MEKEEGKKLGKGDKDHDVNLAAEETAQVAAINPFLIQHV